MELRIKVLCLATEDATPVFTCKADVPDNERYDALRVRLEELGVVNWVFDFWDVEAKFQTKNKLEGVMTVDPIVYLIPSDLPTNRPRKRRCLEVEFISSDIPEIVEHVVCEGEEVQNVLDMITDELHPTKPPASSRVSASEEPRRQFLLIPAPILARFVEGETMLKKELARLSLEDHTWYLKQMVGTVRPAVISCLKTGLSQSQSPRAVVEAIGGLQLC
jgi:hypothetical protein